MTKWELIRLRSLVKKLKSKSVKYKKRADLLNERGGNDDESWSESFTYYGSSCEAMSTAVTLENLINDLEKIKVKK